ncbi:NBS-LRR type resistance protein [Cucumis melo var. makuwa]|uniref:NBS-LRR type resistance protein n=1 Tax=Cucumis melo var. makuwa TaxID=1194695 RepID=A0A5A7U1H9_CUCMM|nr:NBS-LRR type resistance protein [Cucumis melo var. makuwa]
MYQSSDLVGFTYQSSDPEGYTYQSSDLEGCTNKFSDLEGYTYQSSNPEGYTYQSSDPEGCTYQSRNLEGHHACKRATKRGRLRWPTTGKQRNLAALCAIVGLYNRDQSGQQIYGHDRASLANSRPNA